MSTYIAYQTTDGRVGLATLIDCGWTIQQHVESLTEPDLPYLVLEENEIPEVPDGKELIISGETLIVVDKPIEFLSIEPTPFWLAAWDLLSLKKEDVLNSIIDPDARYEAELQIEGRNTYRRDDPMVIQLAMLLGYPSEQMDSLWLYVQEHYK